MRDDVVFRNHFIVAIHSFTLSLHLLTLSFPTHAQLDVLFFPTPAIPYCQRTKSKTANLQGDKRPLCIAIPSVSHSTTATTTTTTTTTQDGSTLSHRFGHKSNFPLSYDDREGRKGSEVDMVMVVVSREAGEGTWLAGQNKVSLVCARQRRLSFSPDRPLRTEGKIPLSPIHLLPPSTVDKIKGERQGSGLLFLLHSSTLSSS